MSQLLVLRLLCWCSNKDYLFRTYKPDLHSLHVQTPVALSNTSYSHQELMQKMTGTHNSQLKSPAQDNECNNNQSASQRGVASELPVMKLPARAEQMMWNQIDEQTPVERETALSLPYPSSGKLTVYLLPYSKFIIFMETSLEKKLSVFFVT